MTVSDALELDVFGDFCGGLSLENGEPMLLEPFQRQMLGDFFEGTRELLVLISKGNGKSSLLAALALFSVLTVPDAEVIIVAASRDQASVMLRQAAGLVRRNTDLAERLVVKQREITNRGLGGRIRVMASDVDTGDGVIPSLVLLDELHRHRRDELYSTLRASLEKRDGQMVVISTAGDSEDSPLGQLRTRAYGLPVQRRDGAYRYAASMDRAFVMNEWSLDPEQDLDDLDLVKSANPLSTITVEKLRERHDSPSTTRWGWARFSCGAWVRGEDTAIDPVEWDALAEPGLSIPNGSPVWVGWDNALRGRDFTAIVPLWFVAEDRRVVGDPVILRAPAGGMLDDRAITSAFDGMRARWRVQGIVFDPNAGAAGLAQQIARNMGLRMVEHSQRDTEMGRADMRLLEAIRRGQLRHSGHQELREHVLNAIEKPVAGEMARFTRPKHGPRQPIDALTALSLAHDVAVAESLAPPKTASTVYFL